MEVLCSLLLGQKSVFLLPALLAFSYFVVYSPDFSLCVRGEVQLFYFLQNCGDSWGFPLLLCTCVCTLPDLIEKRKRKKQSNSVSVVSVVVLLFFFRCVCVCAFLETRCSTVFRFFFFSL